MNFKQKFLKFFSSSNENPILTSFIVLICVSVIVIGLSLPYYIYDFKNFYAQVLAEAHGMMFDIAVIGILIFWLNKTGERRLRIKNYLDEIDDFRLWKSEEAAFRTAGNIKRLNRHRISKLNLVDCHLVKTNMSYVVLRGANLNSANVSGSMLFGSNLEEARLNQTNFEGANLNQANLKNAYASGAIFQEAFLIKANLEKALLIKASFKNAILMEANLQEADLNGAIFTNCNLFKADLRNVTGLTVEQLNDVKSIYKAKFDEGFLAELKLQYPKLLEKTSSV